MSLQTYDGVVRNMGDQLDAAVARVEKAGRNPDTDPGVIALKKNYGSLISEIDRQDKTKGLIPGMPNTGMYQMARDTRSGFEAEGRRMADTQQAVAPAGRQIEAPTPQKLSLGKPLVSAAAHEPVSAGLNLWSEISKHLPKPQAKIDPHLANIFTDNAAAQRFDVVKGLMGSPGAVRRRLGIIAAAAPAAGTSRAASGLIGGEQ
jgi:hypothetical protein